MLLVNLREIKNTKHARKSWASSSSSPFRWFSVTMKVKTRKKYDGFLCFKWDFATNFKWSYKYLMINQGAFWWIFAKTEIRQNAYGHRKIWNQYTNRLTEWLYVCVGTVFFFDCKKCHLRAIVANHVIGTWSYFLLKEKDFSRIWLCARFFFLAWCCFWWQKKIS